jgi:hypothetical protein
MNNLRRIFVWVFIIIGAIPMVAKDDYYFSWKTKGDKMALTYAEKGEKTEVITDYIYDTNCINSYYWSDDPVENSGKYFNFVKKIWKHTTAYNALVGKDNTARNAAIRGSFLFIVRRDGLYGIINDYGQEVLPCKYLDIEILSDRVTRNVDRVFALKDENGWGTYYVSSSQKHGFIHNCQYTRLFHLFNGGISWSTVLKDNHSSKWVKGKYSERYLLAEKDGKYGIIDSYDYNRTPLPIIFDQSSMKYTRWEKSDHESESYSVYRVGKGLGWVSPFYAYDTPVGTLFPVHYNNRYALYNSTTQKFAYLSGSTVNAEKEFHDGIRIFGDDGRRIRPLYYYNCVDSMYLLHNGATIPWSIGIYGPFKTLSFDPYDVYKVGKRDSIGLYNGLLNKEILPRRFTQLEHSDETGFFEVMEKDSTTYAAFICHDRDEVALFNDRSDLLDKATHEKLTSDADLLRYKNGVGLIDYTTGLLLPCVYDSILPVASQGPLSRFYLTHRGERVGLAAANEVRYAPIFDQMTLSEQGNSLRLSTSRWLGVYEHEDPNMPNHKVTLEALLTADGDEYSCTDNLAELLQTIGTNSDPSDNYLSLLALGYELGREDYCGAASMMQAWAFEDRDATQANLDNAIFYADRAAGLSYPNARSEVSRLKDEKKELAQQEAAQRAAEAEALAEEKRRRKQERIDRLLNVLTAANEALISVNNNEQG